MVDVFLVMQQCHSDIFREGKSAISRYVKRFVTKSVWFVCIVVCRIFSSFLIFTDLYSKFAVLL